MNLDPLGLIKQGIKGKWGLFDEGSETKAFLTKVLLMEVNNKETVYSREIPVATKNMILFYWFSYYISYLVDSSIPKDLPNQKGSNSKEKEGDDWNSEEEVDDGSSESGEEYTPPGQKPTKKKATPMDVDDVTSDEEEEEEKKSEDPKLNPKKKVLIAEKPSVPYKIMTAALNYLVSLSVHLSYLFLLFFCVCFVSFDSNKALLVHLKINIIGPSILSKGMKKFFGKPFP